MHYLSILILALILNISGTEAFFGGGGRRNVEREPDPELKFDPYGALDLNGDDDPSEADIKKAYRRLSMLYHPDKNPGEVDKFQKVSRAYEILSNDESKYLYDFGGMQAVKDNEAMKKNGGGGMDPFQQFFGMGGGNRDNRGQSVQMEFHVSMEEIYSGAEKTAKFNRRVVCRGCSAEKGGANKPRCRECGRCPNEIRLVQRQMGPGFIVQNQEEVPSKEKCKQEEKQLHLIVERGAPDGTQLKFPYAAEQKPGQVPGDVIVIVRQRSHARFERRGANLHYKMQITLKEALTGFSKKIKHLDDHEVEISTESLSSVLTNGIVRPGQTVVIKEEGMPVHEVPSQFGDLHVTFDVVFPTNLSNEQKEKLTQIL